MINIVSIYRMKKLERLCCALKIYSCVSVFIEHLLCGGQCAGCLPHRILILLTILRSRYYHYPHLTDEEIIKDQRGGVISSMSHS